LLRIKFNETFTGLIQTEKGEPNCVYVNASIQRSLDYEVKIPLIGCETRRSEDGNYENEITIQNSDVFDAKSDKRYLLTCIPANPVLRDSQVTVSFGGITIDNAATTAISLVNSSKVEYEVTVRDGDDLSAPPLKRPLLVGDRVTYTVHLGPSSRGRIGRCWASDGKSELDLSDSDGCSLQRAGEVSIKGIILINKYNKAEKHFHFYPLRYLQVWGDFEVLRDAHGTTFLSHIKAWAFPTSNEVNIFCNLHVCNDCTQTVCRNRRRRVPPVVMDVTNFRARDDYAPPIPVRASFRLRRDATSATVTTEKTSSPVSRHLNAPAAATTTGRVFPSALYLMLSIVLM
uniref:ZP domain-containing protein n=1 Tax=Angiostrongylus cantonensis TaxID=6313 RepID=A0A0K0CX89_ANGCA